MKGDFTRDTFDPLKHFSRVLMQQGRVTLDADFNEQAGIFLHYLRTLARDLIGPYAGPGDGVGFGLTVDDNGNLQISAGRYYVDGILVENEQDCLYSAQPDYPVPRSDDPLLQAIDKKDTTSQFGVYLDVWERQITWIEDDSIREKALGGPNTCTRAKVVWQVKTIDVSTGESDSPCDDLFGTLTVTDRPLLTARVDSGVKSEDPCITPPASKYRGPENQLYRVEIHQGGKLSDGTPTFKWSRDNGSLVTAWLNSNGNDLQVASARGFAAGNWVELSDDNSELLGQPGVLVQLVKVEGNALSVDAATAPPPIGNYPAHPKVRRWDQIATEALTLATDNAIPIQESPVWIDLEDGVQIQFSADGQYRTGDYWLIPARVATGSVEWPQTDGANPQPKPLPPHGIEHHYAPLGFVDWNDRAVEINGDQDCLCKFYPLSACKRYYNLTRQIGDSHFKVQPKPVRASQRRAAPRPKASKARKRPAKESPSSPAEGAPS